jgi:ABC-2 type transport system ATP-binding protein
MMLEAANISKFYGPRPALESVSFTVGAGEVVGFLGVNGAGKSTAMRILTGFISPTNGIARVGGNDPRLAATRQIIGYLPEANPLPPRVRVKEYLRLRAGLKGMSGKSARDAIAEAVDNCGICDLMDRMIGQLSKGTRQRVGLAESILAKPRVLILDEPTAGLDPYQAMATRQLIARLGEGATVLMSSHILEDIERLCRRVIILNHGRVAADGDLEAICEKNVDERVVNIELVSSEPVRETLRAVPGVRTVSVQPKPETPGVMIVRVTTPAGVDLRQELSQLCAGRGWLITGMHLEPVRLEDIFRKLTTGVRA